LPFVDAAFDAVVSIRVLKYVAATDIALSEVARVLRPDGTVVLEVTNANSIARFGYRNAPVHCTTRRTIERQMRGAGLAPVTVVAGPRLPHAAFVRAHGPRTGRAVSAADRALGALLGTAGARSLIIVGRRM
jgi:SAM-dependent methyltransferase